jgi:cephalosporin hydroxylase
MAIDKPNEQQAVRIGNVTLPVNDLVAAFQSLLIMHTSNYANVRWLGLPIWQDVLSLWTIQETIAEVRPALIIETGTNRGGSAVFYATLLELMGHGQVVTVDIAKMHELAHPRVEWLIGSSVSPEVLSRMALRVTESQGPVMVILDSDHAKDHVAKELEAYSKFVTPGSYLLAQDGIIDVLAMFASSRPGPLPAIQEFLSRNPDFHVDRERCHRFLLTHHPLGWLRRVK